MGLSGTIRDYQGLSQTISDYLGLSRTRVQVEAGESKLLLFETFPLFFSHELFLEELTLLKIIFLEPRVRINYKPCCNLVLSVD